MAKQKPIPRFRSQRFLSGLPSRSPLRVLNFTLLFALVGVLFLLFASAAPAVGFYDSIAQDQVNRINNRRAAIGRPALKHIACLHALAEIHTKEMADRGEIYHTSSKDFQDRVNYACGGSWRILGENVGVGYDSAGLFNAFMSSPGHKANIEDSRFTKIGVGAYYTSDGRLWITQLFANCSSCTTEWNRNATMSADPVKIVPKARRLYVNASGQGYVLDSWGHLWPLSGAPLSAGDKWPKQDLARALAVKPDLSGAIIMDGWGGVHKEGNTPSFTSSGYWTGWDIARDIVLSDWSSGSGIKLDGWGGLHRFGPNPPNTSKAAYWSGWDIARRVALAPVGGYTLDGWGAAHPFGGASPIKKGPYWKGWDIARDIEISPDGTKGYIMDGWGGIHPLTISGSTASPAPSGGPYWPGQDVAVDMVITDWATPKGYVLDVKGAVHPFGGAPAVSGSPYWP